jgi:hypothetical protein
MVRGMIMRLLVAVVLIAAEVAAGTTLLMVAPTPAGAQLFEDLFPFFRNNRRGGWFAPSEREERAPDYSKAPAPKKTDAVPQMPIVVFGDSMADWLAYGLEQAYAEAPEIGILRRHRTSSGLIRTEGRNDPRGEYPDWPVAAKEMIEAQKPKFVVMMIGMNDRRLIKEAPQPVRAKPVPAASPDAIDPAAAELDTPERTPAAAPEAPACRGNRAFEFRTDAWSELAERARRYGSPTCRGTKSGARGLACQRSWQDRPVQGEAALRPDSSVDRRGSQRIGGPTGWETPSRAD